MLFIYSMLYLDAPTDFYQLSLTISHFVGFGFYDI